MINVAVTLAAPMHYIRNVETPEGPWKYAVNYEFDCPTLLHCKLQ